MASSTWPTKPLAVAGLHLDSKNPRLGRETYARPPREIIQYLFDHDKASDVADSISSRGYFPNEPLLAVYEDGRYVVVEGNRRLAALKALLQPGLLEGTQRRQVERFARRIIDLNSIKKVPVTIAPDRRSTDRLLAGRHIGTPVLPWEAENRASFILEKLQEGYDNDELQNKLGFSSSDIQKARQIRAIADMARSIELSEEVKAKLDNPRAQVFTTLGRVFDSSAGQTFLKVEKDADHGIRGTTTKNEFTKAFKKLVEDIALGKQSSRTLNKKEDIENYFKAWDKSDLPSDRKGTFVPSDIIKGKSVASAKASTAPEKRRTKSPNKNVLPKDFHVRLGPSRLADIRNELTRLQRERFPNAGAVLLRVFFELCATSYLERSGELEKLVAELKTKGKLQHGTPTMRQMTPKLVQAAKKKLKESEAVKVEKALRYDAAAPFSISDLHSFVHQTADLPGPRDIEQFWLRTEPLFRLMVEFDTEFEKQ